MKIAELIGQTTLPDRALLVLLLAVTGVSMALVPLMLPHGGQIRIEVKNKLLYKLPLTEDKAITIDGLTVEIKGGKVRVAESGCPGRICVKQGWIDSGAIICLPKRVVITVEGTSSKPNKGVDATT
ncbi:MAG: NusG domain II-containing protein [Nitrospirae bacterium]|nr:NusG domain II-containing protein [Nitrospirota bacterium]